MRYFHLFQKFASKKYPPLLPSEIKDIRRSFNLSQASFAELLDISIDTLQGYEIGRHRTPSTAAALLMFAKEYPHLFLKRISKLKHPPRKFVR